MDSVEESKSGRRPTRENAEKSENAVATKRKLNDEEDNEEAKSADEYAEIVLPPSAKVTKTDREPLYKPPPSDAAQIEGWGRAVWYKVSNEMLGYYKSASQNQATFIKKTELRNTIYSFLQRTLYPDIALFVIGSSQTGLGINQSVLDLCLLVQPFQSNRAIALSQLQRVFTFLPLCPNLTEAKVIDGHIPILRVKDCLTGIKVQICCNSITAIQNTNLQQLYSRANWKFAALLTTIKAWAKLHGLMDPENNYFSSYPLVLMVINYLQRGCHPPVLPHLQKDPKEFREDLSRLPSIINNDNLGQLLLGFLEYYVQFDLGKYIVSVLTGDKVAFAKEENQQCYIFVEDPYERVNTTKSINYVQFQLIKSVFHGSCHKLRESKELASIFPEHANINFAAFLPLIN